MRRSPPTWYYCYRLSSYFSAATQTTNGQKITEIIATYWEHGYGEQKLIKKNYIKEFGCGNAPGASRGYKLGTSQGHPGRLGRFMWKFTFKGQNVRGTDGTDDGTDGTCPRDRRDTNQGVSRQNSLCLLVFFLSPVDEYGQPFRIFKFAALPGRQAALKTHTPQIWVVEIHTPNLGG